jgi:hypothetical protein
VRILSANLSSGIRDERDLTLDELVQQELSKFDSRAAPVPLKE